MSSSLLAQYTRQSTTPHQLQQNHHHQAPIMPVKRMVTVENVPFRPQPSSASITKHTPTEAHVFQLSLDDSDEGSDSEDNDTPPRRTLPPTPSYFSHGGLEPIAEQSDIPPSPHPEEEEEDDEDSSSSHRPTTPSTVNEQQQDRFHAIIERLLEDQFGPAPDSITPTTPIKAIKTNTSPPHDEAAANLNKPSSTSAEIIEPSNSTTSKEWRISKTQDAATETTADDSRTDEQACLAAALNVPTSRPHQLLSIDTTPSPVASVRGSMTPSAPQHLSPHYDTGSIRSSSASSINSPITINNTHHSWSSQYRPMQPFHSLRRRSSKEEMALYNNSDAMSEVTSSVGSSSRGGRLHPPRSNRGGPTFTSYKSCNDLFVVRHALESKPPPTVTGDSNGSHSLRPSASYATLATNSIHSSMFQEPYQAHPPPPLAYRRHSDQSSITSRTCPCPPRQDHHHEPGCRFAVTPRHSLGPPPSLDHRLSTLSLNQPSNTSSISFTSNGLQEPSLRQNPSMISLQHHLPPPPPTTTTTTTPSSKLSIASFSLTHDKDAIKTYRRMANKTNNKDVQMTYCKYLLQVATLYQGKGGQPHRTPEATKTHRRLQEEAEYWIEKLAAAGYPEALYIKGMWHSTNDHACVGLSYQETNHEKAFKCLRAAAKHGWVDASYQVARYWKDRGDYKKTLVHYKAAAHQGHVLANYKMAKILLRGQLGQKVNIKQGLEYLKSAADDTSSNDSAQAAYDLSCIYSDDIEALGMERDCLASRKNVAMAMHYLVKAQRSGLVGATYQLGKVYELGLLDQPQDLAGAFAYYSHAAEHGHGLAMLAMARFYLQGAVVPGNSAVAFKWCQRSASQGLAEAEFMLGTYYESGIGVDADYPRALEYFGMAASKGYVPAAERLNLPEKTKIKAIKPAASSSVDCLIM